MGKRQGVLRVIERWCGGRPERGSDKLRALWERRGQRGVLRTTRELICSSVHSTMSSPDIDCARSMCWSST